VHTLQLSIKQLTTSLQGGAVAGVRFYVLDEQGNLIEERDLQRWTAWWGKINNRRISRTDLPDGSMVSTIFRGLDCGDGLLYTTVVFGPDQRVVTERYWPTRSAALVGHDTIVEGVSVEAL
jgi:hypothetical protein